MYLVKWWKCRATNHLCKWFSFYGARKEQTLNSLLIVHNHYFNSWSPWSCTVMTGLCVGKQRGLVNTMAGKHIAFCCLLIPLVSSLLIKTLQLPAKTSLRQWQSLWAIVNMRQKSLYNVTQSNGRYKKRVLAVVVGAVITTSIGPPPPA